MNSQFEEALRLADGVEPKPSLIDRIAAQTSWEAASWAFSQWDLRRRARAKFTNANQMLFTQEALEQASHEAIAAYHASLFPPKVKVADLTAGIGGDLLALAARGPAIAYEIDAERRGLARFNLEAIGLTAEFRTSDSLIDLWDFEYAFADPSRRVQAKRTLDPSQFSPDPMKLSQRMSELRLGVMKLSPMLADGFLELLGTGLEFVSYGSECRESLVFAGRIAERGRWARQIESNERLEAGEPPPMVFANPLEYVFDVDPAAVRAHALGTLCLKHKLGALADSNGYLTGTEWVDSPWFRSYRVLWSGHGDLKRTKQALRSLDSATPIVKQRGTKMPLESLQHELRLDGTRPLILILYPEGRGIRHLIAELKQTS